MEYPDRQARCKTFRLFLPVSKKGGRCNQENRRIRLLFIEPCQVRQDLQGLSKTHIIRQAGAKSKAVHITQPLKAGFLVRTQIRPDLLRNLLAP